MRGFVSRRFHDETEQQTTGAQLLQDVIDLPSDLSDDEAEDRRRVSITVALTRDVLTAQEQRYQVDLLRPFVRMLVFDAWIGNGDRHSANWAILVRRALHGSACRLAPMYDTAGCLLAEMKDDVVAAKFGSGDENEALARYISKCRSGFGDGHENPGIPHKDLLEQVRLWPEWKEVAPPLIQFFSDNLAVVEDLLRAIPDDWLSPRRRHLIRRLLEGRVKMLQGLAT